MDLQSMMNAYANTLRAELDNSMEFTRDAAGTIVGMRVASFPTNTTEREFLTAYCNKELVRGLIPRAVADSLINKIHASRYTKVPNAARGGYDITFG